MPKPEDETIITDREYAEAVATEATTVNDEIDDDDDDDDDLPEAVAEIETEAVAAAEESQAAAAAAAADRHGSHMNFSSVDMIKAYILNSHPGGCDPRPTYDTTEDSAALTSTTTGMTPTNNKDPNNDHSMTNHNHFSSVTTFTMNNLGSMSSLFATTTATDEAASTAAAVASLVGASGGGGNTKLDQLRDIMEKKLPSKQLLQQQQHEDIAMIPLVYSAGSDRQEAASPTELDKLSRALQPRSKFKGGSESNSNGNNNNTNSKKRKEKSPAIKNFIEGNMTEKDVLMGRGGRSNHHPGNARYLEAKLTIQPRYRKATKEEKTGISQELVDIVKNWGGRFLKLDDATQRWYEVDNVTARKKASQTLREENTPDSRAQKRAKYSNKGSNGSTGKKSTKGSNSSSSNANATMIPFVVVEDAVSSTIDPETTTPTITTDHTTTNHHVMLTEQLQAYQQTDV